MLGARAEASWATACSPRDGRGLAREPSHAQRVLLEPKPGAARGRLLQGSDISSWSSQPGFVRGQHVPSSPHRLPPPVDGLVPPLRPANHGLSGMSTQRRAGEPGWLPRVEQDSGSPHWPPGTRAVVGPLRQRSATAPVSQAHPPGSKGHRTVLPRSQGAWQEGGPVPCTCVPKPGRSPGTRRLPWHENYLPSLPGELVANERLVPWDKGSEPPLLPQPKPRRAAAVQAMLSCLFCMAGAQRAAPGPRQGWSWHMQLTVLDPVELTARAAVGPGAGGEVGSPFPCPSDGLSTAQPSGQVLGPTGSAVLAVLRGPARQPRPDATRPVGGRWLGRCLCLRVPWDRSPGLQHRAPSAKPGRSIPGEAPPCSLWHRRQVSTRLPDKLGQEEGEKPAACWRGAASGAPGAGV